MKRWYILGGFVLAILLIGVGLFVAKGPQPEIVVPAEKLFSLGPLNVTNTILTAWVVMILLIVLSVLATRSMKLMPSGLQNFMEASVGFLLGQCEDIAGEVNGRRFFAVVATIFLFILTANWMGLLPFFNAIGNTEDVGHHIFHEISSPKPDDLDLKDDGTYDKTEKFAGWKTDDSGGITLVKPGGKAVEFEVHGGETQGEALDRYVVFLAKNFGGMDITTDQAKNPTEAQVREAYTILDNKADAPKLLTEDQVEHDDEVHGVESALLDGRSVYGVDFDTSQKLTLVVPWFRGVYSDVNNTLALGIVAFVAIEFWGFQSIGFGYLKKFINFSSPINFFVGILELLSEFIRIISFTFRLFGNIFAGEVLVLMLTFLMPFLLVDLIYGLELFVGFIQAAVFALLTLVFAAMAVEVHGEDDHHDGHRDEDASADAHHQPGTAQAH